MTKEIKELSKTLITEIQKFIQNIDYFDDNDFKFEDFKDDPNDSKEMKLKKQETWYDQMYEKFQKAVKLIEGKDLFLKLMNEFQKRTEKLFNEYKQKNKMIGNKLDSFLLNNMMKTEKEVKKYEFTEGYQRMNYEEYLINKKEQQKTNNEIIEIIKDEELLKQVEEEEIERRSKIVEGKLTKNEMLMIEKEIGRHVDRKIFDSEINNWKTSYLSFKGMIMNKSHFFIVIETIEGNKFGCYIESEIYGEGKYIEDSNAFVFKFKNNDSIDKYPIIDCKNAIKISKEKDDNLFVVGLNDIVIKKEVKKDKCSCCQRSFDYNGIENTLIEKKGNFEIKRFGVWGTVNEEKYEKKIKVEFNNRTTCQRVFNEMKSNRSKEFKQLEDWTSMKCSEIVFDSDIDNWNKETSIFNERIIGKKQLVFLIEDTVGKMFGYYFNSKIIEKYRGQQKPDSKTFHFNLHSKNTRLKYSMKFEIKDMRYGGISLYYESDEDLIKLGDILLFKENKKYESCCVQNENYFDYNDIENALCGKKPDNEGRMYFTPKRILVIQMK